MTKSKKVKLKSDRNAFRFFELSTEVIGWLQIVASPLLLGLTIGAIIFFSNPTTLRLFIGIGIATLGLIVGIIWATKQWKGKGTIWFISRLMATPELDDLDEGHEKTNSNNPDKEKGNR